MNNERNTIKKNALYSVLLKSLNIIFPLITFPYIARILSPEGIGRIDFVTSFIHYFIIISQIGIPIYGIKKCAEAKTKKDLTVIVQELALINFILLIITATVYIAIIFSISSLIEYRNLLLIYIITLFSTTLSFEWFFQGVEDYKYITVRSVIVKTISTLFIFLLINNTSDYILYAWIIVLGISINSIFNFYYMNKKINLFRFYSRLNFKRHLTPLLTLFVLVLSTNLYVNLDKVMLGLMVGDKYVGYYSASNRIIRLILTLVTSISIIMLPRLSKINSEKNTNSFNFLTQSVIDFLLFLSIPIAIGIYVLADVLIIIFAGASFLDSIPAIKILTPLVIFISISNFLGIQVLVSLGKEKLTLVSTLVAAVVNIALNVFLITNYYHIGASISSVISEFIVLIIQLIIVYKFVPKLINFKNVFLYLIFSIQFIIIRLLFDFFIENIYIKMFLTILFSIFLYFILLLFFKNRWAIELKKILFRS